MTLNIMTLIIKTLAKAIKNIIIIIHHPMHQKDTQHKNKKRDIQHYDIQHDKN